MEIGESVGAPEFVIENNELHDESTCPWCQPKKKQGESVNLEPEDPAGLDLLDTPMPPNDGGKLGRSLAAPTKGNKPKPEDMVAILYERTSTEHCEEGGKTKKLAVIAATAEPVEHKVQYAPHHLIPGNEALKGSSLVSYLGNTSSISEYADGQVSKIKDDMGSIGYDINSAENGEWLPSPYALSMRKNNWPSETGIGIVKRRTTPSPVDLGPVTEEFKAAYVAAAIKASGGRQFHMRHEKYSEKVQEILEAVAERLRLMSEVGICSEARKSKSEDGKFDPPYGLVGRLDVLSATLREFLIGKLWRPPLYADDLTRAYAEYLVRESPAKKTDKRGKIEKVV